MSSDFTGIPTPVQSDYGVTFLIPKLKGQYCIQNHEIVFLCFMGKDDERVKNPISSFVFFVPSDDLKYYEPTPPEFWPLFNTHKDEFRSVSAEDMSRAQIDNAAIYLREWMIPVRSYPSLVVSMLYKKGVIRGDYGAFFEQICSDGGMS